jgi:O-antigen ligase
MQTSVQTTAQRINSWLLPLLALSLPVSTSAVSVLAILILLFWVIEGKFNDKLLEITRNEVSVALLLYLFLHVVGLLWSDDKATGMDVLQKQWKLMLMPVFLTALQPEHRRRNIYFFLAGLVAVMLATYLAWFDLFHYGGVTPDHPTRRLFHVVYNPMLAFGFYLVMHEVLWGGLKGSLRWVFLGVAMAMAFNMFITEGRAGQVAFFIMLVFLLLQYFRKNIVKGVVIAVVLLPVIFAVGFQFSPTFHNRVIQVSEEVGNFKENPNTSIGLRLLFWENSWEIIKNSPLIGVGTGDYNKEYSKVNKTASPNMVVTDNPHNQYIMVLCQFGILGLVSLLAIFFMQMRQAFSVLDGYQRIRLAFPVLFLAIMMTESYLIVYETGFTFSLFSSILYKKVSL